MQIHIPEVPFEGDLARVPDLEPDEVTLPQNSSQRPAVQKAIETADTKLLKGMLTSPDIELAIEAAEGMKITDTHAEQFASLIKECMDNYVGRTTFGIDFVLERKLRQSMKESFDVLKAKASVLPHNSLSHQTKATSGEIPSAELPVTEMPVPIFWLLIIVAGVAAFSCLKLWKRKQIKPRN